MSTLHAFTWGNDGANPIEGGIVDKTGVVYGTATGGGQGKGLFGGTTGCGTLYRIAPTLNGRWNFELLYSFLGKTDGGVPFKITFVDSTAYIPTGEGGLDGSAVCRHSFLGSCGTIFHIYNEPMS